MFDPENEIVKQAVEWLELPGICEEGQDALKFILRLAERGYDDAMEELNDRFYRDLEFGTGGMRGIIGEGSNRMNVTVIRRATQGFAEHILAQAKIRGHDKPKAVVAFDSRRNSDLFSFEAACVFAANGIETWLFQRLSATPLLSWTVRKLGAEGGVVVTASHNPRMYNGYKIYDNTGCQCLPGEASDIIELISKVDSFTGVKTFADKYTGDLPDRISLAAEKEPLLNLLPYAIEDEYIEDVLKARMRPDVAKPLSVIYTPLNGAGNIPVRKVMDSIGVGEVAVVPEQEKPDPKFTTCQYPNPEKKEALELGLAMCDSRKDAGCPPDVLIGTDPDSDRLGCAVWDGKDYLQLTGDQVGILFFDYIVETKKELGTMPSNPVLITTIVSSPLTGIIARENGIETRLTLTGFKYIGDQINKLEEERGNTDDFIFGYEESCGYLSGPHVRDKDAVNSTLILCELMGHYKQQGKTVIDRLNEIYARYGCYAEGLLEFTRPGEKGMEEIARDMETARSLDGKSFGLEVESVTDYLSDDTGIPPSNVIKYDLSGGNRVIFRPSGTEPKVKIYFAVLGEDREKAEMSLEELKKTVEDLFR